MKSVMTAQQTRLGLLNIIAIGGLLGLILDLAALDVQVHHLVGPHLIFVAVYLVSIGALATGWRWAPVVSIILTAFTMFEDFQHGFMVYYMQHPHSAGLGLFTVGICYEVLGVLVIGANVLALWQSFQHDAPQRPTWLTATLAVLAGIVLGALFIAAIAPVPSAAAAANAGAITVHTVSTTFSPNLVALHQGDTLTIVSEASIQHILVNGTWSATNRPVPGREPGAPLVNNVSLTGNTIAIGPFTTPGIYHIYCTIHAGMVLTIVVV